MEPKPMEHRSQNYPQLRLYIDGRWIAETDSGTSPVFDPATGEQLGAFPMAGEAELSAAQQAVERGFAIWSGMLPLQRFRIIGKATTLLHH